MKKVKIVLAAMALFIAAGITQTKAQLSISVNIGSQPTWGPVGYDRADYYYLPDVESYYSVSTHQFIYLSNGRWIYAANLPGRYANYDLYSGYKVVVNRPRPYLNYNQDRVEYGKYKGWKGKQTIIRDSRDPKYHGKPNKQEKEYYKEEKKYEKQEQKYDKHQDKGDKHGNGKGHGHGD
ncbi:hypothetical protein KXQ82_17620 [Mucilaginibacter sp. HMF5004]|uniref:hypothetical protein n=1 Tax=Mucilaginibacter rivuli TaxID=2857527 RepID=UPI001C5E5DCD|nr:hypothetical protein [Mucilaginibacter rivuli]MBW4891551.1 hypothetical protein [Mucilaginibacter rivuli]